MAYLWQHGSEKEYPFPAAHKNGWKVLNIQIAKTVGILLNVPPKKPHTGKTRRQLLKFTFVIAARTTPFGTQAYNGKTIEKMLTAKAIRLMHTIQKDLRNN